MKPLGIALVTALTFSGCAAVCPSAVRSFAGAAVPGAKAVSCHPTRGEERVRYEVELRDEGGKPVTVEVVGETVAWSEVPAEVAQAWSRSHPGTPPDRVEKLTTPDGRTAYDIAEELVDAPARAGACPQPKPECVCPALYAPVRCAGGCSYSNACIAACAGAQGCVKADAKE